MNGDALIGLVVLWEAAFEQYSLYYLNLFRITTGLVQSALILAAAFLNAQREKQFLPGTAILRPEAFRNALDLRKTMRRKKIADYLILSIERGGKTWQDLFAFAKDDDTDTIVEQAFAGNLGLQRRRDMDGLQDAQHRDRIGRRDESTEDQAVEKRNGKAQEVGRGIGKQADHRGRDRDLGSDQEPLQVNLFFFHKYYG